MILISSSPLEKNKMSQVFERMSSLEDEDLMEADSKAQSPEDYTEKEQDMEDYKNVDDMPAEEDFSKEEEGNAVEDAEPGSEDSEEESSEENQVEKMEGKAQMEESSQEKEAVESITETPDESEKIRLFFEMCRNPKAAIPGFDAVREDLIKAKRNMVHKVYTQSKRKT
jgi:HD superfamily phosphohydrolase